MAEIECGTHDAAAISGDAPATAAWNLRDEAVSASIFVVSSGPTKYGSVVLPDAEVINELRTRGQVFRTDLHDAACAPNPRKAGSDNDGQAGGLRQCPRQDHGNDDPAGVLPRE
jgi:hypothetical protein